MTVADTAPRSEAGEPNEFGYRIFTLGQFQFSRDEYFAYVNWPTGRHVMSVDAFLRALQRDVAWEFFYGIVKRQPFGNARRQLAFFLQLFVDLKIFPDRRIILRGSHPMFGQIGECKFQTLATEPVGRLGNRTQNRSLRRFPQNSRGLPILVAIDLPTLRIAAGQRDAAQLQGPRIGHGDMAVDPDQEHWMSGRDLVEIPSRGNHFHWPQGFVPA